MDTLSGFFENFKKKITKQWYILRIPVKVLKKIIKYFSNYTGSPTRS